MKSLPSAFLLLAAALAFATPAVAQDVIHYKNGKQYPAEGSSQRIKVIKETFSVIEYELEGVNITQEAATSQVERIEYGGRKVSDYEDAREAFQQGAYGEAIDLFTDLAGRSSPHWLKQYSLFHIAESLYAIGDWNAAIQAYEKLLSAVPDSRFVPDARYKIGLAKMWKNDLSGAEADFKALQRETRPKGYDPAFEHRAQLGLIRIDATRGNSSLALSSLDKLLSEVGADYPEVRNECRLLYGEVLLADQQFEKAANYFQAILDSGVSDPAVVYGAYNGLGDAYFAQSKFREALKECYLRVVVMDDRKGSVPIGELAKALYWAARCWDQLRAEKPEYRRHARELYREVIARAPGTPLASEAQKFIRR